MVAPCCKLLHPIQVGHCDWCGTGLNGSVAELSMVVRSPAVGLPSREQSAGMPPPHGDLDGYRELTSPRSIEQHFDWKLTAALSPVPKLAAGAQTPAEDRPLSERTSRIKACSDGGCTPEALDWHRQGAIPDPSIAKLAMLVGPPTNNLLLKQCTGVIPAQSEGTSTSQVRDWSGSDPAPCILLASQLTSLSGTPTVNRTIA